MHFGKVRGWVALGLLLLSAPARADISVGASPAFLDDVMQTLGVKLFQSPPQQWNPLANIILKDQPPTSQASRNGSVGLQRVSRSEFAQLRDVLL